MKPVRALVVDGSDDPDGAARVHTAPSGAPTQTTGDSAPMRSSFSIHSLATDAFNYTVHSEPGIYKSLDGPTVRINIEAPFRRNGPGSRPFLVLIPAAARQVRIPLIASGGFATGSGLVAALALGASAVNMGTRFVASTEAPVHQNVKDQIVANDERATQLVFREFNNTARVARNTISEEIARRSAQPGATFADVADLASGARGRDRVLTHGDMHDGMWWAGQAQGLIDSVQSCQEIVDGIIDEADRIITGLGHTIPATARTASQAV
ncbi:possible nitropropane dioxygenase [Rhodococcus jostii RHA1]|uniref:Possible nitropropane dioxygenase n=1 Tax=Rhodococcus jostii (strain RHA1) TaxID=101510 RepID=Q0SD75_RHOJR|nr:nitronate monooxygenase [Rhodococcus jostii]ABG94511.1 possible nitropropane dioxygenase [Rhodococcus jostii RHA1]